MKIEFPALESEPLIYFLFHSGVFVIVLAGIFFGLGLCLGRVLWGRYKHGSRVQREEGESLRGEIADLKRKLAEQALRPSPGPLQAVILNSALPDLGHAPAEPLQAEAPVRTVGDVPAMPELAGGTPVSEPQLAIRPKRPRTVVLNEAPGAEAARPAQPSRREAAAIAPFSFLMETADDCRPSGAAKSVD